jgi:hypothetical protein
MKYYKDKNNIVFAYETEEDRNKFGSPALVEMSAEEVVQHTAKPKVDTAKIQERLWRDGELTRADIELYKVQDSDPKAVGTVAGWREYRKALRSWPNSQDFPDISKRPVAPDAARGSE